MLVRRQYIRNIYSSPLGMQNGTAVSEDDLAVSYEANIVIPDNAFTFFKQLTNQF